MKIKRIAWRNITSYGNKVQRMDFEANPGFYMLTGENATGKSSFLNCITFALYGKVSNKSLKDIPNRKNKNAWVRIELEASGRSITIERGISPSLFELSIDGAVVTEAGKANIQKYLEDEVFRMPFYVFDNLISLNINDFKSFIDMTPSDKRAIIDKLFSLDIINQMRELLKGDVKEARSVLEQSNREIEWIRSSIDSGRERVRLIIENAKTKVKEEIEEINARVSEISLELKTAQDELAKIEESRSKVSRKKDSLQSDVAKCKYAIESKNKDLETLSMDSCPTCKRDIDDSFREHSSSSILAELQELKSNLEERSGLLESAKKTMEKIDSMKLACQRKINEMRILLREQESRAKWISSDEKRTEDTAEIESLITDSETLLETKTKERTKAEARTGFMKVLEGILGEGGMKQMAIRNLLPVLNGYIQEFSKNMGSDYEASFDEDFEAKITHLGEEISPKTLSTGETKKLDVIVLLSLIRLIKMRFPELNILFLDEIFSSVDHGNVYHVIRMLARITKEMRLNTIVVNHSQLPHEEFDYVLRTTKSNGFSSIELERIG